MKGIDYGGILKEHKLQVTSQRIEVLKALKTLNTHITIEDVKDQLELQDSYLTLATLYNVMNLFVTKGLVRKTKMGSGRVVYDANISYHMHLFDEENNKVIDYDNELLNRLMVDFFKEHPIEGFDIDYIHVVIDGKFK